MIYLCIYKCSSDLEVQQGNTKAYVGLKRDDIQSDQWRWVDGSQVDFTEGWADNEPSESGNCVTLSKEGKWQTKNCSTNAKFDCKLEASK